MSDIEKAAAESLLRLARAKERLGGWRGPLRGELFEARTKAWRDAVVAIDRAALALRRERIEAYLASRRARQGVVGDDASA